MLTHHTQECATSSLKHESHWLFNGNGSFLLTEFL